MKLGDLMLFTSSYILQFLAHFPRIKLTDEVNKMAINEGFYHCVPSKEIGNSILNEGKIKASSAHNSYGKPATFMFLGVPSIENYIINLEKDMTKTAILKPEKVIYAVKMMPKLEELGNYKSRLADGAIVHEGSCIIPRDRTKVTQLVLDLVRDKQGNVVLDKKGNKRINLRERTEEEVKEYVDTYIPSKEFLEALEVYKKENGYHNIDILGIGNTINTVINNTNLITKNETAKNSVNFIKRIWRDIVNPKVKIEENRDIRLYRKIGEIEQGKVETKKPVRSKEYVESIIKFINEGIEQKNMSKVLPEFLLSREGNYLKQKMSSMDDNIIKRKGIHGIKHSNRTTMLALMIAKNEGINLDDKMLDILVNAGFMHDIGRIADIGKHAKRSAKLVSKMNLKFLNGEAYSENDMRILETVIESHEGSDKHIKEVLNKYEINGDDINKTERLISILRDADALDRARLSSKGHMNLNTKYLKNKSAKELIDFSFQLEKLTEKENFKDILLYNDENVRENIDGERKEFLNEMQKGILPDTLKIDKEQLKNNERLVERNNSVDRDEGDLNL